MDAEDPNPDPYKCVVSILQIHTSWQLWQLTFETQNLPIFWPHSRDLRILFKEWEAMERKGGSHIGRFSGLETNVVAHLQRSQEAASYRKSGWKRRLTMVLGRDEKFSWKPGQFCHSPLLQNCFFLGLKEKKISPKKASVVGHHNARKVCVMIKHALEWISLWCSFPPPVLPPCS